MKGTTPRILSFLMALALLASAFAMVAGPAPVAEASTNNTTFDAISLAASQPFAVVTGEDEQNLAIIGIAVLDSMIIISTAGLSVTAPYSLSAMAPDTRAVVMQAMSINPSLYSGPGVTIAVAPVHLLIPLSNTAITLRFEERQTTASIFVQGRATDNLALRTGWRLPEVAFNRLFSKIAGSEHLFSTS